ncbi:hypothetical protein T484DRAFT_1920006 [Baffinella frigidus]|nr:hypothetical protein T484DRAFT_1920006 [Cryptophyta sp. CCMP2293]
MGGLLSFWEFLENRHLRLILRMLLLPLLRHCTAEHQDQVLGPVLPQIFADLHARLHRGYTALAAGSGGVGGAGGGGDAACRERLVEHLGGETLGVCEETALRQLHREAVDLILSISNLATQAQMLEGGGSGGGVDGAKLLLRSEASARSVLHVLAGTLVWHDSIAKGKAIEAAGRLVGLVGAGGGGDVLEACRAMIAGELFSAALSGLASSMQSLHGDRGDIEGPLSGLVTDIYGALAERHPAIRHALVNAGFSSAELSDLETRVLREASGEKAQRVAMRAILQQKFRG